jgi:hypothetical protein
MKSWRMDLRCKFGSLGISIGLERHRRPWLGRFREHPSAAWSRMIVGG